MGTALTTVFKKHLQEQIIAKWFNELLMPMMEGGLSEGELQVLKWTFKNAMKEAKEAWDAFKEIAEAAGIDMTEGDKEGLAGGIKGITEETAGLIAGQFNALMINTVEINRNVAGLNLNAGAMASHLESIVLLNARIAENTSANPYILEQVKILNDKVETGFEQAWLRSQGG